MLSHSPTREKILTSNNKIISHLNEDSTDNISEIKYDNLHKR